MSTNALTEQDKSRTRYHLGYPQVEAAASLQFGLPAPGQLLFILEAAMENIMPDAVPRLLSILTVMDNLEQQIVDAQCQLSADVLGELTLAGASDPKARLVTDRLEAEYVRFGHRAANILGAPPYPFSERYGRPQGQRKYGAVAIRGV